MKRVPLAAIALFALASCNNKGGENAYTTQTLPKPGTIICKAEMPVNDPLNHFTFGLQVVADSNIAHGVYDVRVNYEYYTHEEQLVMPKNGEFFKPVIRTDTVPFTYIIGFKVPGDTTFYDYYQVSASKTGMDMKYIKAYSFQ